ncbi:DNA topoisomerase 4 subunit A [Amylibacter ulvae]|uniref:DNA topoisomerase 4 subunit A n=2 Tax=Paramylibacter ulvae TaxID=1651968 RepID=A0ABQ3D9R7_9RHOB|nr:DNA topoisomerase 4 subunit A [Amylibacter ulvae]
MPDEHPVIKIDFCVIIPPLNFGAECKLRVIYAIEFQSTLDLTLRHRYTSSMADNIDEPDMNGDDHHDGMTIKEPLRRAIGDRYLTYALSTIMHRALPDARDGLKPVHRRILYAMRELKLASNGGFRKSAKISGDVMGNYHPHGDQAIYDALARLAQDFNVRYPLVDGQGNFGNIDGDNPAAARYTEARMTAVAEAMLEGLSEDAVDFRENYDGSLTEPAVLPASFPNLLANGSSGIAVGMATNIPPHNIGELCDAAIHLIGAPNARDETLMDHVPGPDFPTGGILVEPAENILNAYKTGRGSFRLRSKWEVEDIGRGMWQVVVTEIPYQVQKSKLIEKIAELIQLKKIPILADVRDESAEDIRLVLEPRAKTVEPTVLMETLFRLCDLETRFSMNLNVLIDGRTPKVCSMKEVLRAFLDHRRDVLYRRSKFRMDKIDRRLEVLEGYIVAFLNLDRVIEIIREEDEPKPIMMEEFSLSDVQVEAILNMRLRSLRRLEEMELRNELDALQVERAELDDLLGSEELQWNRIKEQLRETRKQFGKASEFGARRTVLEDAPDFEEVPLEAMIEKEPITVVCSAMGWVRAMKGHIDLSQELKFKDGDEGRFMFHAETTDKLVLFGSNGRFYTLPCSELPGGRGMGEPIRLMVDLPNDADMMALFIHDPARRLLLASSAGDGFVVEEKEVLAQTRTGKQVLNVRGDVTALVCKPVSGDHLACVGQNRKVIIFPLSELPEMVRGKGVRLQKYKDGGLSDATTLNLETGLQWLDPAGRTRTETELADWIGKRAGAGRMAPRGFPHDNKFNL